jgi:transposase InsO family protein
VHDSTRAAPVPPLDDSVLAALAKMRGFSADTIRLLLQAKELIMLALGLVLGQWRASRDPVSGAFAEHCQAEILWRRECDVREILSGRIRRIPPAQRIRYTPEERFRIVVHARTYRLSIAEAAAVFMVDPHTIARWIAEVTRQPDKDTVGSLVKATPPLRSYADVTRQLVAMLDELRVGGSRRIAQMLVRARIKVSHETVRRYRKDKSRRPPPRAEAAAAGPVVRAKRPNHVWMTDVTTVPGFLRLWMFKLVVILDVYSRFPLAFRAFSKEPTSEQIADLVRGAAVRHGRPQHFVTDRGSQFTGGPFVQTLHNLRTKQRYGAIGRTGSIAIIERLWRTLKEMLELRVVPPLSLSHLEHRVELGLCYYATWRPHQGLRGATPAELYFGQQPAGHDAVPPPRAGPGTMSGPGKLPFEVVYLDAEQRLPFLVPTTLAA